MQHSRAIVAAAHPNIAFIKYWGSRDPAINLPMNGSLSMNLGGLFTRMRVTLNPSLKSDRLFIDGEEEKGASLSRLSRFLERVRQMSGSETFALVESWNNFPIGAGIASSASAYAALSLAASRAYGLLLDEKGLSRLARYGSGSACRSVPAGFVEWLAGEDDYSSYAISIAPPDHWELIDLIAVVSQERKMTSSAEGHRLAATSILQNARVEDAPRRLQLCRQALLARDFDGLAAIVELDSTLMHAVMMTSSPPLFYWHPATLEVMRAVMRWRHSGIPACFTVDAGPNVHVLCLAEWKDWLCKALKDIQGVTRVIEASPGGAAWYEDADWPPSEESFKRGSIANEG